MTNTIPLGDLVEIKGGGTPSRTVAKYWNGPIPWATVKDFKSTILDSTLESITLDGVENSATNLIPAGTIIIPTRMAVGKAAINTVDMAINQDLKAIVPKKGIDRRFLLHFLLSKGPLLEQRAQGATVKGITLDVLRTLEFPEFTIDEQRHIAAILDKAEVARRKREQALAMTEKVLQSVFMEMLGDPVDNPKGFIVEEIGRHLGSERAGIQSGPFGSALKKHEYVEEGIPVWGVDNVQQNQFVDVAKLFITEEKFELLKRYSVLRGDVLISRAGTVGRMCIAKPTVEKSIISTNLVRVTLDENSLLPEYFVSLFTYFSHRLGALKANNKENAFTFLNPKTLRASKIPIPPVELQEEYRLFAKKLERQADLAMSQLAGLDDLFASLSQRAFRGEL